MSSTELLWRQELDDDAREAVTAVLEAATTADGVAPVSEQVVASLHHRAGHRAAADGAGGDRFGEALRAAARHEPHLLALRHGVVVGYAHVEAADPGTDDPAVAELVVHPGQRRKGVGRRLVDAVTATAADVRVWAHGDLGPARALATELGLVPRRELRQLRRPLGAAAREAPDGAGPLPEVPARDDVVVRTYRPGADDEDLLAVNNAAFDWHPEQGGMTAEDLAEQRAADWFDEDGFFLAHDAADGALLGFHWTKVHPPEGDDPSLGEVYVVGISPAAQGRGLGRLLTLVGLHHLEAAGLPAVLLYVESDNAAAVHTYERLGFTPYHVDVAWGRPAG
ncbi:mycothiol synthase [Rhodococcus aerolatus]